MNLLTITPVRPTSVAREPRPGEATRDRGLDTLRALALTRVFLWHATGWAALTWIGAIPIMFYVTGQLLAASIDRRGARRTLLDRARRLLIPYWFFGVVAVTVMAAVEADGTFPRAGDLLGWIVPLITPEGASWQDGWITEPLWYLRTYSWLLLATPLLVTLVRRGKTRHLLVVTGTLTLAGQVVLGEHLWALQDLPTYGFFLIAGIAARLGTITIGPATRVRIAVLAAAAAAAAAAIDPPAGWVVNNAHFLHLSVGVFWLMLAQHALPSLRNLTTRPGVGRLVDQAARHSLTIYLWHAPLVGLAYLLVARLNRIALPEGVTTTLAVTAGLLLTVLAAKLFGPLEDFAGRRGAAVSARRLLPGPRTVAATALVAAATLTVLQLPTTGDANLPPTPSQAPDRRAAITGGDFLLVPAPTDTDRRPDTAATNGANPAGVTVGDAAGTGGGNAGGDAAGEDSYLPTGEPWPVTSIGAWDDLAPRADDAIIDAVTEIVADWARREKNPDVQIAVLQPGRLRMVIAVDANGNKVEPADEIPLASITKSFTATILLRAVEEGRIRLNDPVGTLTRAPWFTMADDVTVAELLSHRSGIANYTDTRAWTERWEDIDGWETALRAAEDAGKRFPGGTRTEYSSTNFVVAGLLAEQLYGQPVETLIREQLLDPLGLTRTRVTGPVPGSPGTGTGNMYAHVTDVARWAQALWRDGAATGPVARRLVNHVAAENLFGYGTFGWCPCTDTSTGPLPAAVGANGAEATVRYYRNVDTIIAMRISGGIQQSVEQLLVDVLSATR